MIYPNRSKKKQSPIKLFLADSHELFREGLKRILDMENNIQVVGGSSSCLQVLEFCNQQQLDIILIDLNISDDHLNGIQMTAKLQQMFPTIKTVVMCESDDEQYALDMLWKGVSGYLIKDMEVDVLLHAIRFVHQGYVFIHPKVALQLVQTLRPVFQVEDANTLINTTNVKPVIQMAEGADVLLTPRQTEVLRLIAKGKSNKKISEYLFISEKTVKNHVSSILQKMEVNDRTQAVVHAIKYGWIHV